MANVVIVFIDLGLDSLIIIGAIINMSQLSGKIIEMGQRGCVIIEMGQRGDIIIVFIDF